jgi:hypothetical protein
MVAVMKFCKDCKFIGDTVAGCTSCLSPKASRDINLITGEWGLAFCEIERRDYLVEGSYCGTEGKNWEAKDENVA